MRRPFAALLGLVMLLLAIAPAAAQNNPRLAAGDVVVVTLPGEDGFNQPFKLDREGRIDLPEVGPILVGGLTLSEARDRVRATLATSFRDLSKFGLTLKERRLLLTVAGFVKQPGPVDLPAGATVQMAIIAAGGLSAGAQLDKVQVRREGRATTFDYKRYLDTGDPSLLPALRTLDEIFVPASPLIGNVQIDFDARTLASTGDAGEDRAGVRVFGEVNTPGAYAYKPNSTVVDAILRAGGVTHYASVEQIRIITAGEPQLFNLKAYLDTGNTALNPAIKPGTTIFVPRETEEVKSGPRTVYVMGEVAKPGAFELRPDASFFDVLANAGGPNRYADSRLIRILRENGTVDKFDLAAYTENPTQVPVPKVVAGDAIFVPEKVQGPEQASWLRTPPSRAVRVIGAVKSPGRFEWSDEFSLFDLIAQAGGPTEHGDLGSVLVTDSAGRPRKFDMRRFIEKGGRVSDVPEIRAGYTVMVPELPVSPSDTRSQWVQQPASRSIYILGSVGRPGRYAFEEGLSFLDVLAAADGPTAAADVLNIRVAHRGEARDRVSKVNLAAYLNSGDDTLLPSVKPGDVIFVPDRNRNWLEESPASTVRVLGAVGKPGRYQFADNMSILDLLAEAGGPTREAYQEKIVVVNLSCCGNEARLFNLIDFAKSGNFSKLPVLRAGDTVYVPTTDQSDWKIFMDDIRDAVSVLTIIALLKAL